MKKEIIFVCQYGYISLVTDHKNLTVKDDNSLYRFQAANMNIGFWFSVQERRHCSLKQVPKKVEIYEEFLATGASSGAAAVVTTSAGKGRGSDRSLTEAAHEVPFCFTSKVPLSSSQSHLHELPVRDSGVSPEKTLPKMDACKGGLQVPGSSVM
ncbi:unnamed protein product [Nezara viridula]|uniref:Uncharacterized protein n=1 Tax=Nezara viridula TaxID=85310 RepID=A0A9P0HKT5_NEZVI|nr:unnamed protein product [Nezara viridula]